MTHKLVIINGIIDGKKKKTRKIGQKNGRKIVERKRQEISGRKTVERQEMLDQKLIIR